MAEWIKVLILGVVEGLTEFLPVSSTGHLIVTARALNLSESLSGTFEIFIQIGAVVAVLLFYLSDFWRQARTITHDHTVRRLWLGVLVAFLPAAVLGLLFDDLIESLLFSPTVVAVALIVGGVLFLLAERYAFTDAHASGKIEAVESLTLRGALLVGLMQTLALIPGMSRSGMSIIGGMAAGMNRRTATQFSFYLAVPTLGGATVYTLVRNLDELTRDDLYLLLLGAIVSGIVAWLSIRWLLAYVANHTFVSFGLYRIAAGLVLLVLIATGYL